MTALEALQLVRKVVQARTHDWDFSYVESIGNLL